MDSARTILRKKGVAVRVLACRYPGYDTSADVVVPTRYVGTSRWPLPTAGLPTVRREVSAADVVVANNARQALPVLAVAAARLLGRPAVFVLHGSGEGAYAGRRVAGLGRAFFQRTVGRIAVRASWPVSVSRVGARGARRLYGVDATYLPYPVRELPSAPPLLAPGHGDPFRVAWVGRLSPEKDPTLAVRALDRLRLGTPGELLVCGDGPLRGALEALVEERPWLHVLGARSWSEVQELQASAHACLATSALDNVQVALLEALCRGIPAVSTRVGDAASYYIRPPLRRFCVAPGDPGSIADALAVLAASYAGYRREFAENAALLIDRHSRSADELVRLIRSAAREGDRAFG